MSAPIWRTLACITLAIILASCSTAASHLSPGAASASRVSATRGAKRPGSGGYYQSDGPGTAIPANLVATPDAVPRNERPHRYANRPYVVLGKTYAPLPPGAHYRKEGIVSWYGRQFHGKKTASGEIYNMYAMTAASPVLSIPSYARVTNTANGRSVIVRINDRGPFHANRIMDLSYAAAVKLGYIGSGSTRALVESVTPNSWPAAPASRPPTVTAKAPEASVTGQTNQPPKTRPTQAAPATLTPPASSAPVQTAADEDPFARFVRSEAEETPARLPPAPAAGRYLQLGAFASRDNAEAFKTRMGSELGDALAARLIVVADGKLHRVQLGPYPDDLSARRAADEIRVSFDYRPVIVRR